MNTPIYVNSPGLRLPDAPSQPAAATESADLLRQLVELQKEQIHLLRIQVANQDALARWKAFLARWQEEFPDVAPACKQVLPAVERAYMRLMQELTDRLRGDEPTDLDNEYELTEFLDRYGVRLNQLSTVMSQLAPLSDVCPPPASDKVSG
jgi:hypothetical protein